MNTTLTKSSGMEAEVVRKFLQTQKILVVEPSTSFGQTIINCLIELGAQKENCFYAKQYVEAIAFINAQKPSVLLSEYFIGEHFGLSLLEKIARHVNEASRVCILVTHNADSSAVAEAAEEDVDAYVLKPFSMGDLKERLIPVIYHKTNPSNYLLKLREGKTSLQAGNFSQATEFFDAAKSLSQKPSLAHYYFGYTKYLEKNFANAYTAFESGLKLQPLHYKCLLGEFDVVFQEKRYADAYKIIPVIRANFPVSPKYLGHFLISAVLSNNIQDVPIYYDLYTKLDHRTPELVKICSAALLTAGRHYIQRNEVVKASDCFTMGVSVAGPKPSYLDTVIRELLKVKATDASQEYLKKFPRDEIGQKTHAQLDFLIDAQISGRDAAIERGRKLVSQGFADQECYKVLLKLLMYSGRNTFAEDMAAKAVRDFPDLRKEFYDIIEGK